MKLSEALTAMAARGSFASEQEQRDVLAAIERDADRIDGDAGDVQEPGPDDRVSLTPAGAAATSSAQRPARAAAKKATSSTARRKGAAAGSR